MNYSRLFFIVGAISIALLSRFFPHPPNFTAINALALFGASCIGNIWITLLVLLASMFLSDLVIGFHSTIPFVYLSFSLVIIIGHLLKDKKSLKWLVFSSLGASLLFFLVANFGVWMTTSYYPKTFQGLQFCYLAAIPFLQNQVLGDLLYTVLMFSCFSLLEKKLAGTYAPSISKY
jgi:hypothetical protein